MRVLLVDEPTVVFFTSVLQGEMDRLVARKRSGAMHPEDEVYITKLQAMVFELENPGEHGEFHDAEVSA